jgi:hypothetical protein
MTRKTYRYVTVNGNRVRVASPSTQLGRVKALRRALKRFETRLAKGDERGVLVMAWAIPDRASGARAWCLTSGYDDHIDMTIDALNKHWAAVREP